MSKSLLVIVLFSSTVLTNVKAQERKDAFSLTAGYTTRVFDTDFDGNASGIFLGLNMFKTNATGLSTEAQLSFNVLSEQNSASTITSLGVLYGLRVNFNSSESDTRIFFNLLLGPAVKSELGDDFTETLIDVGYSSGIFVVPAPWVFGISLDNPGLLSFKVGYIL